ncbi:hypothetical protein K7E08_01680 [Ligilactobacillus salivarius]|uniref:hypothetical protein n=1 Tax=Ligilactobacillus salivarius TaxID=1624 RepID=UPI001CBFF91F|nr:hypothetical protein [Ligilactobacillus salivarius]MBZ4029689.1 hypothetical protein [Ligilactobacillus salivarius]
MYKTITKKHGNIGVDIDVQNEIKALVMVSGHKFIRGYMRDLIDEQVKHLSAGEYEELSHFPATH